VEFLQPQDLEEALALKAAHPDAMPICGGTDVMVDINFDRHRPPAVLDLGRVAEIRSIDRSANEIVIGAGATWTEVAASVAADAPALALAARTVGSPQIRNRGTLGGNLGTASPACDGIPPLVATGAEIEVRSAARGARRVPAREWIVRPRRSVIEPDELIVSVHVPALPADRGAQQFAKIGTRNAMVISVVSLALSVDVSARRVGVGIGSAGPVVMDAPEAQSFLADEFERAGQWTTPLPLDEGVLARFGELVSAAATPIDDVRGTAAYRRRALEVMARRTLTWTWDTWTTNAAPGTDD
jgi:CO/xanthine dehydrogenase FAD-binding subunit